MSLSPDTLTRLRDIAEHIQREQNVSLDPMQVAAVLLEKAAAQTMSDVGDRALK